MHSKILSLVLMILLSVQVIAQEPSSLPRALPEEEGVSSNDIIQFVDAASKSKTEFHSFMLLRHGKVIAEGWWNPYRSNLKHTLYSCSKSFTATAVGFAVQEKKLSLDDKVISFFPGKLAGAPGKFLSELTVKDVIIMSDGMEPDPSFIVASKDSDWIKGFLSTPILHEPGTVFLYNSLGTYMLSAIVQKVTGQTVLDYLRPRLFGPLGITGEDWETDLQGINTGGWGLRLKTEDMAKFAELFLQEGKWNGKQVIDSSWIHDASTAKIMQDPSAPQSRKDSSDWLQGYCYQMWRCRHNAFRGDGAFGQFMIVMPEQDAVLAITAETSDMQDEINLVWKYLLPAFKTGPLSANPTAVAQLKKKLTMLALPLPPKKTSPLAAKVTGKTFKADANDMHIQSITFNFTGDECKVRFENAKGSFDIPFGAGKWQAGETNMPGPSLTATGIENISMLFPAKIMAAYTWQDDKTLQLVLRYIESPHTQRFTCHFMDNKVTIEASRSFDNGGNKTVINASIQ